MIKRLEPLLLSLEVVVILACLIGFGRLSNTDWFGFFVFLLDGWYVGRD
jgi:hypothetical protein